MTDPEKIPTIGEKEIAKIQKLRPEITEDDIEETA